MTTAAMVRGVVPLILASGAGAVSRFNMGVANRERAFDRDAVYAVRGTGGLSVDRDGSFPSGRAGRFAGSGGR
jgi:hypothetical protein